MQVVSLDLIKGITDHRSRSQRSNNGSKMATFRLKSRYLKKFLTYLNDFGKEGVEYKYQAYFKGQSHRKTEN